MTRGTIKNLGPNPLEITAIRALSQVGRPVKYHLQYPNGGTNPNSEGPEDKETMLADCVALAWWARGVDRFNHQFPLYDGYMNTDSAMDEALGKGIPVGKRPWFTPYVAPKIGRFIVGRSFFHKLRMRTVIGHVGVVTGIHPGGEDGKDLSKIEIVHCSPYNYQFTDGKSAIWKTSAQIWSVYPTLRFLEFVWTP